MSGSLRRIAPADVPRLRKDPAYVMQLTMSSIGPMGIDPDALMREVSWPLRLFMRMFCGGTLSSHWMARIARMIPPTVCDARL